MGTACALQTSETINLFFQIMGKPFIDFAAIKAAVTITQVLERYGVLATLRPLPNRDGFVGRCPIHQGTSPDQFKVSVSKNCWNCFGDCKGGGNVLDFVARMESISAHEAAHQLNEWFGLNLEPVPAPPQQRRPDGAVRRSPSDKPTAAPASTSSAVAETESAPPPGSQEPRTSNPPLNFELKELQTDHPYFAERGLQPETVAQFGLGFCAKGTMRGRIVIPIHNDAGALVGYAGRLPGPPEEDRPKYKLPKDFLKSAEVFNLNRALGEDPSQPIIVTEGYFDVMVLWQHGWRRVVSIMGSHLSARQQELLVAAAGPSPGLILLFDEDDAGRAGRLKALQSLAPHTFVKAPTLQRPGSQPDHLSLDELQELLR